MKGLLVQSLLFGLIGLPILAARERSATRGLKKALMLYVGFGVLYTLALRFIYPHLPS